MIIKPYDEGSVSIYIHWPFCLKKCPYCDFNSYVRDNVDHKTWYQTYFKDFEAQKHYFANKKIKSIFFGGGTPSLMEASAVAEMIAYFTKHNGEPIKEITLESNPSTFEIARFKDFKQAGVNRLSTGIQSFSDKNLKFLGRNHNVKEAISALEQSNEIFERTSFDLIMGLPHQSFDELKADLELGLKFFKEHISIYQLTIEEGTLFFKNKVKELNEEVASVFFEYIVNTLYSRGIKQYEISNFALPGCESIHNLNYWRGGEYLGFGPNAQGRVFYNNKWYGTREYKNPNKWLESKEKFEEFEEISTQSRFEELVMTQLRVNEPLPKYLVDLLDKNKINNLVLQGLLSNINGNIQTTKNGILCLNYVIKELLV